MYTNIFTTDKKYRIIYADPPWKYKDRACKGACEKHYPTMKIEDICTLPISNISDKDCILFMWVTYPMLKDGFKLIESWGFKYKTIGFQWLKTYPKSTNKFVFGLGRWTRGNTECCLIATKGKPKRINNSISQLIISPLGAHSAKPGETREKIVSLMGDLPKIELFARQATENWDYWGNEVK